MNIKDKIIEKTALELKQPESLVDKVVSWQFKNASDAVRYASQIEISGFGTFTISQPKVKRRIQKHEEIRQAIENKISSLSEAEQVTYAKKLDTLSETLSFYKQKLTT